MDRNKYTDRWELLSVRASLIPSGLRNFRVIRTRALIIHASHVHGFQLPKRPQWFLRAQLAVRECSFTVIKAGKVWWPVSNRILDCCWSVENLA